MSLLIFELDIVVSELTSKLFQFVPEKRSRFLLNLSLFFITRGLDVHGIKVEEFIIEDALLESLEQELITDQLRSLQAVDAQVSVQTDTAEVQVVGRESQVRDSSFRVVELLDHRVVHLGVQTKYLA